MDGPAAPTSSPARRASVSPANTDVTMWRTALITQMRTTAVRLLHPDYGGTLQPTILTLCQIFSYISELRSNQEEMYIFIFCFFVRGNICVCVKLSLCLQTIRNAPRRRALTGPVTTILSTAMACRTAETVLMNSTAVSRNHLVSSGEINMGATTCLDICIRM